MEVYEQILMNKALELSTGAKELASQMVELECYRILLEIKEVIENEKLDDPECFERIEDILTVFERHGIACDFRHDFG